jgi:hypothetical protein
MWLGLAASSQVLTVLVGLVEKVALEMDFL